jgi:hypothetical protein
MLLEYRICWQVARVSDAAELGTVQLTNLDVRGCTNLARMVLPTDPRSWRCLNVLNYEEEPEGCRKPRTGLWTVEVLQCVTHVKPIKSSTFRTATRLRAWVTLGL